MFKGPFRDRGMPDFTGKLKEADIPKLQAFIQGTPTQSGRSDEVIPGRCKASNPGS